MGKISQVSAKYVIHTTIKIEGTVDKPDIIGAVFGQTEGLLGSDLELRELQRNGRIGRIEVNSESKSGKTQGTIQIPSSLDKAETCVVAAALEIIERIGPCNAKLVVQKIEDVRISKRDQVVSRAKELLRELITGVMPDSQEISEEVAYSVRVMEIETYGKDKLPAGPAVAESDEVVIVEGRADVLNLLKYGFKNAIAMNGTSVPQTIIDISKEKSITVFVDGDRGGDLIIRELSAVAEIDFITKAPDGKEVEEITMKEINKALRSKVAFEQAKSDIEKNVERVSSRPSRPVSRPMSKPSSRPVNRNDRRGNDRNSRDDRNRRIERPARPVRQKILSEDEKIKFKELQEELVGSHGAFLLDNDNNIMGKVPVAELSSTIKSLKTGIQTVIMDGAIDKEIALALDSSKVKIAIATENKESCRATVFTEI